MYQFFLTNWGWCAIFGGCLVAGVYLTVDLVRGARWEPLTIRDGEIVEVDQ